MVLLSFRRGLGGELRQETVPDRPHGPREGVPLHVHFVYAGGEVGPQAGTVVLYGRDVFYCQLDYWQFYNDGHELYLTPNGVILSYVDVPAQYLYFMRRPPHEEDVGAKRWNKRQQQGEKGSTGQRWTRRCAFGTTTA